MQNGIISDWKLAIFKCHNQLRSKNHQQGYLRKCLDAIKSENRNASIEKTRIYRTVFWDDVLKREANKIIKLYTAKDVALWNWISKMRGVYSRVGIVVSSGDCAYKWNEKDGPWRICLTKCASRIRSQIVKNRNDGTWNGFLRNQCLLIGRYKK